MNTEVDIRFVLALLTSRLFAFYVKHITNEMDELFPKIRVAGFRKLPIRVVPADVAKPIVSIVDRILLEKKSDYDSDTAAFEAEIDQLVYKLYVLTEEEIAIVEGWGGSGAAGVRALPDGGHAGLMRLPCDGVAKPRRRGVRMPAAGVEAQHADDDEELE